MVPKDWNPQYLDDIAEKVMVGIASAATHAYSERGIRMLRNLNIKEGYIDDSDILYVNEEYEKQHKNKRLKPGDILTVRTGYPGLSAVVPDKYDNAQCFTSLITRLKTGIALPEYICRFINSEYGKKYISSGEAGGAQKNVNASTLKRMLVPLPPLPEQKKIARTLSTWDKTITNTEKRIDNSKQQKKALMQQLLTGKKRFPGFEGEWEEVKLGSLAKPGKGNFTDGDWIESPYISNEGCRLIQTGNIGVGVFKNTNRKYISHQSFDELKCKEVSVGNLLICRLAEPAGRACVVPELNESKMLTSVDVTIMKVDESKSTAIYLSYYFSLDHTLYTVSTLCGGSTRSRVSRTNLANMKLSLPPLKEQQKIAAVLTNADKEIELLEQQLADLKQEKKALMQQLLTGKRRVNVDEAEVA